MILVLTDEERKLVKKYAITSSNLVFTLERLAEMYNANLEQDLQYLDEDGFFDTAKFCEKMAIKEVQND